MRVSVDAAEGVVVAVGDSESFTTPTGCVSPGVDSSASDVVALVFCVACCAALPGWVLTGAGVVTCGWGVAAVGCSVPSSEPSGGLSGLATTVVAPAVANAVHAGTGRRMRSLPFDLMSGP